MVHRSSLRKRANVLVKQKLSSGKFPVESNSGARFKRSYLFTTFGHKPHSWLYGTDWWKNRLSADEMISLKFRDLWFLWFLIQKIKRKHLHKAFLFKGCAFVSLMWEQFLWLFHHQVNSIHHRLALRLDKIHRSAWKFLVETRKLKQKKFAALSRPLGKQSKNRAECLAKRAACIVLGESQRSKCSQKDFHLAQSKRDQLFANWFASASSSNSKLSD